MSVFDTSFTDSCFADCTVTDVLVDLQILGATGVWPGGRRPAWVSRMLSVLRTSHVGVCETIALRWCINQLDAARIAEANKPRICNSCYYNSPGL